MLPASFFWYDRAPGVLVDSATRGCVVRGGNVDERGRRRGGLSAGAGGERGHVGALLLAGAGVVDGARQVRRRSAVSAGDRERRRHVRRNAAGSGDAGDAEAGTTA